MGPTPTYPDVYAKIKAEVKQRVSRWPSAYASGQLVRSYKDLVSQMYGPNAHPYLEPKSQKADYPTQKQAAIEIKQRLKNKTVPH